MAGDGVQRQGGALADGQDFEDEVAEFYAFGIG